MILSILILYHPPYYFIIHLKWYIPHDDNLFLELFIPFFKNFHIVSLPTVQFHFFPYVTSILIIVSLFSYENKKYTPSIFSQNFISKQKKKSFKLVS